jgi:prepilin-type processing-associated H-X9-DG protein
VQRAREAANQLRCANNLRQVGLALEMHHQTHGVYPNNGGWDGQQMIRATDGTWVRVYTQEAGLPYPFYWGVGDPARPAHTQTGSWAYAILPFLEQEAMYRERVWTKAVPIYICPSRRLTQAERPVNDRYGSYNGGGWAWGKTDYAGNALVLPNRPRCLRVGNLTDGTSHTILAGEKAMSPELSQTPTWYWDEPFFIGGSDGTMRKGRRVLPDSFTVNGAFRDNWGSTHTAGAQFLFADGSVRLLRHGTSSRTVRALLTPAGGEVVPDLEN